MPAQRRREALQARWRSVAPDDLAVLPQGAQCQDRIHLSGNVRPPENLDSLGRSSPSRMGMSWRGIGAFFAFAKGRPGACAQNPGGFRVPRRPAERVARIDKTYVGRLEKNKHAGKKTPGNQGGSLKTRIAVAGLYEQPKPGGRARFLAWTMLSAARETFQEALATRVDLSACTAGDMVSRHNGISSHMVNHRAGEYVRGRASTNGVESMWAIVKRMHKGVHVKLSQRRLDRYLKRAAFRLNEFPKDPCLLRALSVFTQGAFMNRLVQR